jgi:AraC-like DNA-binding protein/quercetin dioxygenase-like cupin family protein
MVLLKFGQFRTMKVIPFSIPKTSPEAFRVQVDDLPHLYNHLHQHPEIQLTLVKESHGTLIAGDYMGPFAPGDVFVIGSNQPHVFRNDAACFRKKKRALALSVFFDDTTLGEGFWQLPELKTPQAFFNGSRGGYRVTGRKRQLITEKMEALIPAGGINRIIGFLELLKILTTKKDLQPLSRGTFYRSIKTYDGNRLNKVLAFTFTESNRPIPLAEAARQANLSPEAFCKYFKTRTRKTYTGFLNEVRINNACRLLQQEDQSIAAICYGVGFSNLSHFNRVFKKLKKKSPREYRKEAAG